MRPSQRLSSWDGRTYKTHPVTGEQVPDEAAQVPQWRYSGARKADWPQADFIVGNPPFIGKLRMREALGDGYVEALRSAWPEVPESVDFVMFWWHHAAAQVAAGHTRRMGLITTNSLTMVFNRRVVQAALDKGSHLHMAIADHPWVDSTNGAAVRIAMTVLASQAGEGSVMVVTQEMPGEHGEATVTFVEKNGIVHADLSVGANVTAVGVLRANSMMASRGVIPHGPGFLVNADEAAALGMPPIIREYRNGRDLADRPRGMFIIDAYGLTAEDLRNHYPATYQWLLERVKPERDTNRDPGIRNNWWLHARPRSEFRPSLAGLSRYMATGQVSKHRVFQFLDASILPDNKLIAIALADAFHLGVLSSQSHGSYALAAGSTLEDRPVYVKTTCFETFPFPDADTGLTPELRNRIASLAEQIDAHRKKVLGQSGAGGADLVSAASMRPQPLPTAPAPSATPKQTTKGLTLTGLYNVLEALREGRELTAKEKAIHTQGLVGVLRDLHDELDAAVLQAYSWSDLHAGAADTPELLERLVALNARRAAEEQAGTVRWLRPEFQSPATPSHPETLQNQELPAQEPRGLQADLALNTPAEEPQPSKPRKGAAAAAPVAVQAWPATLPEQVRAVAAVLASANAALPLDALEARFKSRGAWKKSLPRILETLEALGRARREGDGWRS